MAVEEASASVQLVFDTNILIDILLSRGHYYQYGEQVLEWVRKGEIEGWYAAHTLPTVHYIVESSLRREAAGREKNCSQVAHAAIKELFDGLKPLPQIGDELLHLDAPKAGDDVEDLLIVRLAEGYLPNPLIVTRDKWFLKAGAGRAVHPKELIEQGLAPWEPPGKRALPFIDLAAQQRSLWPQIAKGIQGVLTHGQYIMGPEVRELEQRLQDYTGAKHCITVASGTEALLISLMALDIGPGDEVITTPFTFVATAEVIVLLGAKPVFVDIEPDTCNINASLIEEKITERTKAIMPVSLYGQPADMDEINAIAARHGNIPVIEDAAQSFGAEYKGRKSCNLSTIGCTSFFPSKPLGCYGDGGAIFTSDDAIAQACREIRVHGQSQRYVHTRIGVGGRMDTLQCAVVLAKLDRFDWEVEQRIRIGRHYNQLMDEAAIQRVQQRGDRTSVFAQYTVMLPRRDQTQVRLKESGIPTAVHYPVPLNQQPAYRHLCCAECTPVAARLSERVMSLPVYPGLTQSGISSISCAILR